MQSACHVTRSFRSFSLHALDNNDIGAHSNLSGSSSANIYETLKYEHSLFSGKNIGIKEALINLFATIDFLLTIT